LGHLGLVIPENKISQPLKKTTTKKKKKKNRNKQHFLVVRDVPLGGCGITVETASNVVANSSHCHLAQRKSEHFQGFGSALWKGNK
jgi:hypothetical protein